MGVHGMANAASQRVRIRLQQEDDMIRAWKADGTGWRARIGLLTHMDLTVPEGQFWAMAPDGVSIHVSRVPFRNVQTFAEPPGVDNATELLAKLPLQGIIFGFTAGSYLLGPSGEQSLVARLEERSNGIPVIMPCAAVVAGLRALGARRLGLFHPPWYTDEWIQKGLAYFKPQGFEVVQAIHWTPAYEVPHPNLGQTINPTDMYEWVRKNTPSDADAVFIAGNGWRTVGVIAALEEDLGRPVLTADSAALWYALRRGGVGAEVNDYGQVFKETASAVRKQSPPREMAAVEASPSSIS
jgi:maleate isomerase